MLCEKVLNYLKSFFKKFSEDCRDYAQMFLGQLAIDKKELYLAYQKTEYSIVPFLKAVNKNGAFTI